MSDGKLEEHQEEALARPIDAPRKGLERMLDPFGFPIVVDGDDLHFTTRDRLDIKHLYGGERIPDFDDPTLDSVAFRFSLNGVEKKMRCTDSETPGWYELSTFAHEAPLLAIQSGETVRVKIETMYGHTQNRIKQERSFCFLESEFVMPSSYVSFGGVPVITFMPTNTFLLTLSVAGKRADGTPIISHAQCNFKL